MQIVAWVIQALQAVVFVDALLTWFPQVDRRHPAVVALHRIVTPILNPIRRLIPPHKTGYIDISPLVAIMGLSVIEMVLASILR